MNPFHGHSFPQGEAEAQQYDARKMRHVHSLCGTLVCGFPIFDSSSSTKLGPFPPHVRALCQNFAPRGIQKTDSSVHVSWRRDRESALPPVAVT
jgi:hypothetical protein